MENSAHNLPTRYERLLQHQRIVYESSLRRLYAQRIRRVPNGTAVENLSVEDLERELGLAGYGTEISNLMSASRQSRP